VGTVGGALPYKTGKIATDATRPKLENVMNVI
jgi:hypothetical protein